MATTSRLAKFIEALQAVYAFPTAASETKWTPPPATAGHLGRYLWTDAFGVLNFITLYKETTSILALEHAETLVHEVHHVLGHTRDQKQLLPGATITNPLGGGLRIGKEEEFGEDGDGQYHHYLTLWMFALNRLSIATDKVEYNTQAIQLAKAIHSKFVYHRSTGRPRMFWKMSMDLSKPLVRSEGNLDPISGFVVFRLLQERDGPNSMVLSREISDYHLILRAKDLTPHSTDTLDLGMSLWVAHWFRETESWARELTNRAAHDIRNLATHGLFERDMQKRLAFRDFGTVMGIKCSGLADEGLDTISKKIIEQWEDAGLVPRVDVSNTAGPNTNDDLLPITNVMYCAALIPTAFKWVHQ